MNVHLLVTCLGDNWRGATLTFKTLRVGFPDAEIVIWGNDLTKVMTKMVEPQGNFIALQTVATHDSWIEHLVYNEPAPFWICDTDIVFFESVEKWKFEKAFAGRYEPSFIEPWTRTRKAARLHTCLMYVDPAKVRAELSHYYRSIHPKGFPFAPEIATIRQYFIPRHELPALFYDTCAGLYHAIGGQSFTEAQDSAFEHLHCGTYVDLIGNALPGLEELYERVYENPQCARGIHEQQAAFYEKHKI